MKEIAVIDYNAGNIRSVLFALQRLGIRPVLSRDPEVLVRAEKIIFPGVGEAGSTMAYLRYHGLDEVIRSFRNPFLGICLGLQLMCRHSAEGEVDCLGIFDVPVVRLERKTGQTMKIPHMGWNTVNIQPHALLKNISSGDYFYFVHSYYAPVSDDTVGSTYYGAEFSSVLAADNFFATQFHPEKSGAAGETLLNNFIRL